MLGAKELGNFLTTSVLITFREITNHARQKRAVRASHHLMTLALMALES